MLRTPAVKVEHLTKRYGTVTAVDDVSFEIARGSCVGLLGGNGAGKTTTIAMIMGLLLPSAGRIEVLDEDMLAHRFRVLPRINFSSPYMELPHRLTVAENLRIYAELYEVAEPKKRIAALAETLDLVPLLTRPAGRLSAGQKTRVGLAKSLLNDPEFLALDEPTASLDPDTADRIRGYLESYRSDSGGSILLASHNMAEVERLCDEVLMMRSGTIVDRGAPADLIARYGRKNLEEVFLDIARTPGGANALPAQAAQ
ncbi:MAG: ABC transporter ATP-binding protein [Alphaproteobacteria bacterium]|jgi:ABC-2 type transport system ATP-binding protein